MTLAVLAQYTQPRSQYVAMGCLDVNDCQHPAFPPVTHMPLWAHLYLDDFSNNPIPTLSTCILQRIMLAYLKHLFLDLLALLKCAPQLELVVRLCPCPS